jgi:transcriptional regulator with XRE-family HTH domain
MMRVVTVHEPPTTRRETAGDRIERQRLGLGWTQADLAERASISQMTIYRAETGHAVYAWVLAAIAEALNVSMDWLWRGEEAL